MQSDALKIEVWSECPACQGSGLAPGPEIRGVGRMRCPQCALAQPGRRTWPGYLPELVDAAEVIARIDAGKSRVRVVGPEP